jgi:hypothetical protein
MIDYATDSMSQNLDITNLINCEILYVEKNWLLGGLFQLPSSLIIPTYLIQAIKNVLHELRESFNFQIKGYG